MRPKISKEEIVAERLMELSQWLKTNDPEPKIVYRYIDLLVGWLRKKELCD